MKNILYPVILLFIISSCKKDKSPVKQDPTKPAIARVSDSVSYVIDGKAYMANIAAINTVAGNQGTNQKVNYVGSGANSPFTITGDADSVLFYRQKSIASTQTNFSISFVKKYNKKQLTKNVFGLFIPTIPDVLKLYAAGTYPYAEDFNRTNTQNGIALSLSAGKGFSTYIPTFIQYQSKLKAGFQKKSTFNIISFTKTDDGGYNLVAKFTAIVVDEDENEHTLENGYLQMYVDTYLLH